MAAETTIFQILILRTPAALMFVGFAMDFPTVLMGQMKKIATARMINFNALGVKVVDIAMYRQYFTVFHARNLMMEWSIVLLVAMKCRTSK